MKKIKLLACVVLASLSMVACRDAIDIVQDGEVTKEVAVQTVDDLRSFLVGNVYNSMSTNSEIALTSYFTDETAIAEDNSGWYVNEFRYQLFADNSYASGTWVTHYNTIDKANRLIDLAKIVTPGASSQAEYNSILAEARAIRAFSYLQLLSFFSEDMTNDSGLGVMLSTEVQPINAQLPRSTNAEVFSLIQEDLEYAEANLLSTATDYKYITKAAVLSLKARMYAYRGDAYATQAEAAAKAAIAVAPALAMAPGTTLSAMPYVNMWGDSVQGEVIFALSRPQAGTWANIASLWTTNTTSISGAVQMGMGFKLYESYGSYDVRRVSGVFVDATSTDGTKVINKYPGKGNTPLRNDIKLIRTSELYFILAEAYIRQSKLTDAATAIQAVRTARLYGGRTASAQTYSAKADAFEDLLKERRLELCFEGHRYVDLRRLGKLAGVSIDRSSKDDRILSSTPLTLSIDDHRFTFPIPQNEILGNPQLKNQQNTGY